MLMKMEIIVLSYLHWHLGKVGEYGSVSQTHRDNRYRVNSRCYNVTMLDLIKFQNWENY